MKIRATFLSVLFLTLTACAHHADHVNLSTESGIKNALKHGNITPNGNEKFTATGEGNNREISREYALAQAMHFCSEKQKGYAITNEEIIYQRGVSEGVNSFQKTLGNTLGNDGIVDFGVGNAFLARMQGYCE